MIKKLDSILLIENMLGMNTLLSHLTVVYCPVVSLNLNSFKLSFLNYFSIT